MKYYKFIALLLVPMLALAGQYSTDSQPVWGPSTEGCRVRIAVDKENYNVDEPIILRVWLQNQTRESVRLVSSEMLPYNVTITDSNLHLAPKTAWGQDQSKYNPIIIQQRFLILRRGEMAKSVLPLNRAYDMSRPGTYEISVSVSVPSDRDPNAFVGLTSNALSVNVVAGEMLRDSEWSPVSDPQTAPSSR